jgi:hypothetical protein
LIIQPTAGTVNLPATGLRPTAEKAVALFRRYFLNRTDRLCFFAPWRSPCPIEGGSNLDAVLAAHVLGEAVEAEAVRWVTMDGRSGTETGRFRLGSYSPDPQHFSRYGAIDIDGGTHTAALHQPLDVALTILEAVQRLGLVAYLESSGSATGWHVWVFFAVPVPAAKIRRLLFGALPPDLRQMAETNRGVEVFPKQDRCPNGGVGNQVWLPWWHGAAEGGNLFYRVQDEGEIAPFLPDEFTTNGPGALEEALLQFPEPAEQPAPRATPNAARAEWQGGRVSSDTLLRRALAGVPSSGRNDTGLWLACQLRDNGYSKADAGRVMEDYAEQVSQEGHPYTKREAQATLRSAFSQPKREAWKLRGEDEDGDEQSNATCHVARPIRGTAETVWVAVGNEKADYASRLDAIVLTVPSARSWKNAPPELEKLRPECGRVVVALGPAWRGQGNEVVHSNTWKLAQTCKLLGFIVEIAEWESNVKGLSELVGTGSRPETMPLDALPVPSLWTPPKLRSRFLARLPLPPEEETLTLEQMREILWAEGDALYPSATPRASRCA